MRVNEIAEDGEDWMGKRSFVSDGGNKHSSIARDPNSWCFKVVGVGEGLTQALPLSFRLPFPLCEGLCVRTH